MSKHVTFIVLMAAIATSSIAQDSPLTQEALKTWLTQYEQAWEAKDPAAAAGLFADSALYYETPFSEPFRGQSGVRDYWARVTADQREIDFTSDVVAVSGNTGIARWGATLTSISSGARVELNGVFVLEFGEDGRCTALREWWHAR
jgi:ketosteroid isomerase-like protein